VVIARLEEVAQEVPPEEATMIAPAAARTPAPAASGAAEPQAVAVATPPPRTRPVPEPAGRRRRRFRLRSRPVAILLSVVIVLCLILAGGYLATRQVYFIGTNPQGIVTIYQGVPYDLPFGISLYETNFVSGVPGSLVPASRRKQFFDGHLRSLTDAMNTIRALELGNVSK
jgi:hypothetical protein